MSSMSLVVSSPYGSGKQGEGGGERGAAGKDAAATENGHDDGPRAGAGRPSHVRPPRGKDRARTSGREPWLEPAQLRRYGKA
jgi:hypothetical protein